MKISHLNLNQFGVWSDLDLNGFSGGLNVLYGPRGAGKRTLVDFIRSMFYGFDPHTREQYIGVDAPRSGGSLTVEGRYGRQTVCRYDDGSRRGNFAIENEYGVPVEEHRVHDMLSGIDEAIFDRVFAFSLRDRNAIDRLVDGAIATGFALTANHQHYGQRRELTETLNECRRQLAKLPRQDVSLEVLQERRQRIEADIEAHARTGRRYGDIWTYDKPRWIEEITTTERQLNALQDELHEVNQAISSCEERRRWSRTQSDQAPQERVAIQSDWYAALDDMEYQLQRWRDTLQDLEEQRSRVQREQFRYELSDTPPAVDHQATPRHYLSRIESEIRELQGAAAEPVHIGADDYFHRLGRVKWDATLQQMRHDVHRLCLELSRGAATSRRHEYSTELERLRQCEIEMRTAIRRLMVRRREYLDKLQVEHSVDTAALYRNHAYYFDYLNEQVDPVERKWNRDWLEVADTEIKRLLHRRDSLQWHMNSVTAALNEMREKSDELPWRHDDRYDRRTERNERELAEIESQLRDARERLDLTDRIATIEEQLRREGGDRRSTTLEEASEILARITRNELRQIHLTAHRTLWIEDANGERVDYDRLGTGPRDQVYLSLCLALVNAYGRQNIRLPLVINDICVNLDADWAEATIDFLHDLGEQGQQIIALTGEERIVQLFRWRNVWVCELPRTARRRVANGSGIDFETVDRYSAEPHDPIDTSGTFIRRDHEPYHFEDHLESAVPTQRLATGPGRQRRQPTRGDSANRLTATQHYDGSSSKFYVTELSPIEDTPSLDSRYASRMRSVGVQRVGDLLRIVPSDLAARLSHTEITANMVRVWQAEALLCCRVPNLRPYDARILVACGITDPDELSKIHPSGLLDRVEAFANTKHGRDIIHSGSAYELSRLTDWIRSARGSRGKWSRWSRDWNGDGIVNDEDYGSIQSGRQLRSADAQDGQTQRRKRKVRTSSSDRVGNGDTGNNTQKHERDEQSILAMERGSGLKHYLEMSDDIVDAPSIGPRMAERMEAAGINTVGDLLRTDAASIADRMDHDRTNATTVHRWQLQTEMCVRIPQLRGHDAQILVACGVETTEQLAASSVDDLWSKVEPFVATSAGKRILRNGKQPDIQEVRDWITWAQHARLVHAA